MAQRIAVAVGGADERLLALTEGQRRRGFREVDSCELGLVLVQFPEELAHGELHGRAIAWMKGVLRWTGLGDYVGFDDSGDLTIMGEATPNSPPTSSRVSSRTPASRPTR